jgi:hypothetical protein
MWNVERGTRNAVCGMLNVEFEVERHLHVPLLLRTETRASASHS